MDLSPEDREVLLRQARESTRLIRALFGRLFLAVFLVFAGLMLVMVRSLHNTQGRVVLGLIVVAVGIFLLRAFFWASEWRLLMGRRDLALRVGGKTTVKIFATPTGQPPDLNAVEKPGIRVAVSETFVVPTSPGARDQALEPGRSVVQTDLSQLPPELANNPKVQELLKKTEELLPELVSDPRIREAMKHALEARCSPVTGSVQDRPAEIVMDGKALAVERKDAPESTRRGVWETPKSDWAKTIFIALVLTALVMAVVALVFFSRLSHTPIK